MGFGFDSQFGKMTVVLILKGQTVKQDDFEIKKRSGDFDVNDFGKYGLGTHELMNSNVRSLLEDEFDSQSVIKTSDLERD